MTDRGAKEERGNGAWGPACAEHTDVDCESECIGRIRCSRDCGVGDATPAERHRWGCSKASALRRRGSPVEPAPADVCAAGGCGESRDSHHDGIGTPSHAFIEPHPIQRGEEMGTRCAKEGCLLSRPLHDNKAAMLWPHDFVEPPAQPDPDAAVRASDEALFRIAKEWTNGDYGRMMSAVREAFAAGAKAEREACEKLLRARADVAYVITDLGAVHERKALHSAADAIARRSPVPK